MISMPGKSFSGPLPPMTPEQEACTSSLRRDVEEMAGKIGARNDVRYEALCAAADYVEARFRSGGLAVGRQRYEIDGKAYDNLEIEVKGTSRPGEIVVAGAHYDSVFGCPGADDNATGVAALLWLGGALGGRPRERTLRFVAFVNEEPPHFMTDRMGSRVYARRCAERKEKIVAMMSVETIGYYSDQKGSQNYPAPFGFFYPSQGDFIAFVGNVSSRKLVRRAVGLFRKHARFPSEGGTLPGLIPGVGWSDHGSFWEEGYPALMVTDTAPFRYPYYHLPQDTPDKIDYARCARVVEGLGKVIEGLLQRE